MERREFVTATGSAGLALLAGCVSGDDDDDGDDHKESAEEDLPSEVETVLGSLPDAVDGEQPHVLLLFRPSEQEHSERSMAEGLVSEIGLSPSDVDLAAVAIFGEFAQSIAVVTGSFDADAVEEPSEAAAHVEDDFAIGAIDDDEPWDEGRDAAVDTDEDSDAGLADEELNAVLAPVADHTSVQCSLTLDEELMPAEIDEGIERLAVGQSAVDETTEEVTYAILFESDDAVDESAAKEAITVEDDRVDEEDLEFDQREQTLVSSVEQPLPPHQLPDDSPDARFHIQDDQLAQRGSAAVSPATLELRVDDEVVDPPWDGREEEIEPGETFEITVEPFSLVEVYWLDPEREDVEQPLGTGVVTGDTEFTESFDADAEELTITYESGPTVDTDTFVVRQFSQYGGGAREGTELSELAGDTLEAGDSFTVADVTYGVSVSLQLSSNGHGVGVYNFTPQPGEFEFEDGEETLTVTFRGESQPADHFEITSEDRTVDTQFDDEYEELTDGDQLDIAATVGDEFTVEWTGGDEPVSVGRHVVVPEATFDIEYEETALVVTHAGGESIDAGELELRVAVGDEQVSPENPWAEEFDTVSEGDSVRVSLDEQPEYTWITHEDGGVLSETAFE